MTTYKIKNWNEYFETSETRKLKTLTWIKCPLKRGRGFNRIMRNENSAEIWAAWILIMQVAAQCPERGVLSDSDGSYTALDLADKTGFPQKSFETALQYLTSDEIGWIEKEESPDVSRHLPANPQNLPTSPDKPLKSPDVSRHLPANPQNLPTSPDRLDKIRLDGIRLDEKRLDENNTAPGGATTSSPEISTSDKQKILDYVYLTQSECDRLKKEFGKKFFDECVFRLNAYLVNNEKKRRQYKDHNLVIRTWVIDEVKKRIQPLPEKEKPPPPGPPQTLTSEEAAAAEEGLRIFKEQTQKIIKHVTIKEENTV